MTRFADIQILRYELPHWETLTLREKRLLFCLSEATLWGRDITFDQYGQYNLRIRKTLESVFSEKRKVKSEKFHPGCEVEGEEPHKEDKALMEYLQRVWFSSGIYHHYSCKKFLPEFSEEYFRRAVLAVPSDTLPLCEGETAEDLLNELIPVMFNPEVLPTRVNHSDGEDLITTSANNFYEGVTQAEAEAFYDAMRKDAVAEGAKADALPSYGLNSRLVKDANGIHEEVCYAEGRYGAYIKKIIYWLEKALEFADDDKQHTVIERLIDFYRTGCLKTFDEYSIAWVQQTLPRIDFVNGFIEVYADPIGMKGTWEGIVHYKDLEATQRTITLSENAQWFEDHSPVDDRFKKKEVKGVTANVVCAAMLGGEEYPSTAIGINLPNADWIRASHGSKSITIGNLTAAYDRAAEGSGFREEFIPDASVREMIHRYGHHCDDLHTDLHECLGHGSGQLLPGVQPDALKSYASTIEEARADLFGLYYIADPKLVELGLLPDMEAYKSQYYTYMLNGLLTQGVRIPLGEDIQEAHMRNRALIANWALQHSDGAVEVFNDNDNNNDNNNVMSEQSQTVRHPSTAPHKSVLVIHNYERLRHLFGELLAEIQRIKSEGDHEAARQIVETYGVKLNPEQHREIRERYERLDIAPYKGFLNPVFREVKDAQGNVTDIAYDLTEEYNDQMMRYGREYSI